jgi:hypothetical protein
MLPRARQRWEQLVGELETVREVPKAREAIRELVGERIVLRNDNGAIYAEIGAVEPVSEILMVAGAGYVRYLTEPVRIPIPRKLSRE